jgi:hypothetical protein
VVLLEGGGERLRPREFWCGCTCVVSVCEIEPVASGLLLDRDVFALQAATPIVIRANAAARAVDGEHNISRTRDIYSTHTLQDGRRVDTQSVNMTLSRQLRIGDLAHRQFTAGGAT